MVVTAGSLGGGVPPLPAAGAAEPATGALMPAVFVAGAPEVDPLLPAPPAAVRPASPREGVPAVAPAPALSAEPEFPAAPLVAAAGMPALAASPAAGTDPPAPAPLAGLEWTESPPQPAVNKTACSSAAATTHGRHRAHMNMVVGDPRVVVIADPVPFTTSL